MRNMTKACAFLVVVCVAAFGQQQSPMQETLTNSKIIRMVESNMSPDMIIQAISKCTPGFAVDPISVENMKQNGVPEDIVKAITAKQNGQPIPGIERPLDSTGVIRMWQAGVSKSTILQEIARRTPEYHFDTASLHTFEIANVPEDIIKAMAARENGPNQPQATEPPAEQPQQTTAKLSVQPLPGDTQTQQLVTAQPTAPAPITTLPTSVPNPKQQYDSKLGTITIQTDGGVFIDKNFVQAAHPAALMMTNIAFNKYVSAFGEVGYTRIAKASGNIDGVNVSENAYVLDYGWGGRFIIPTGTRVVPYAVVGLDRAYTHVSVSATGVGAAGVGEWAWDLNFGGGVNVFVTRNIGFNFDCRIYRLLSDTFPSGYGTNWFEQAAFGVVFQFNGATGKKL
jgi:hypothetical protein